MLFFSALHRWIMAGPEVAIVISKFENAGTHENIYELPEVAILATKLNLL